MPGAGAHAGLRAAAGRGTVGPGGGRWCRPHRAAGSAAGRLTCEPSWGCATHSDVTPETWCCSNDQISCCESSPPYLATMLHDQPDTKPHQHVGVQVTLTDNQPPLLRQLRRSVQAMLALPSEPLSKPSQEQQQHSTGGANADTATATATTAATAATGSGSAPTADSDADATWDPEDADSCDDLDGFLSAAGGGADSAARPGHDGSHQRDQPWTHGGGEGGHSGWDWVCSTVHILWHQFVQLLVSLPMLLYVHGDSDSDSDSDSEQLQLQLQSQNQAKSKWMILPLCTERPGSPVPGLDRRPSCCQRRRTRSRQHSQRRLQRRGGSQGAGWHRQQRLRSCNGH